MDTKQSKFIEAVYTNRVPSQGSPAGCQTPKVWFLLQVDLLYLEAAGSQHRSMAVPRQTPSCSQPAVLAIPAQGMVCVEAPS